jgi:cyclopropane fatty-acyl-phospholipid synthase-like methyltransferase
MKTFINKLPIINHLAQKIKFIYLSCFFTSSERYWTQRYKSGRNSGIGSYNKLAEFKAEILNTFVKNYHIKSVIEFGCGDGNQLKLASYPEYIGYDVSEKAVSMCQETFKSDKSKVFKLVKEDENERSELVLSLDVIFHLVEDEIFESYMRRLFSAAERYVIIYSSNTDKNRKIRPPHVRHRKFTDWVDKNISNWKLLKHIANKYPRKGSTVEGSSSDFYIYERSL